MNRTFTGCTFSAPGKTILTLPNKDTIEIKAKTIEINGLLYTVKNFNAVGQMHIIDLKNNVSSIVSFDSHKKKRTGYWTSWVKGADKVNKESGVLDNRRDLLDISIQKETGGKVIVLAEGWGSYIENISFDEKAPPLWTINDSHMLTKWIVPADPKLRLPSDSSKRRDLILLAE